MIELCPNCSLEFIESRESHYHCKDCGWFKFVDDKWRSCPEPPKIVEPPLPPEPSPPEPAPPEPVQSEPVDDDLELSNDPVIREYLGGLVTVETYEDEEGE